MEYLVTMTTHVPAGTAEGEVAEVRAREAERARELAAEGHLLRLWRPPLSPGEWRTLGLFAAADPDELETLLASMPLRIWRTDEIALLLAHPNDPGGPTAPAGAVEYFVTFTLAVPAGTTVTEVNDLRAREAERTRELAAQGSLERLWALDRPGQALGLWRADSTVQLDVILASLPMRPVLETVTTPLSAHPSDPG